MTNKLTFNTVVGMIEKNNFKYYPDENRDPNDLIRKRVTLDFYRQCFNIIKDHPEPKIPNLSKNTKSRQFSAKYLQVEKLKLEALKLRKIKLESLKKLEAIFSQNQNDKFLPLISSVRNTILKFEADFDGYKKFFQEVKVNYKFERNLIPKILTHIVLDSLILNDDDYVRLEDGLTAPEGIVFLTKAIKNFLNDNTHNISKQSIDEFKAILNALRFGFHFNIIEEDYDVSQPQLENHLGLLMHLITKTLEHDKFVFIPLMTYGHCITLVISKNQDKYRVKIINTGDGREPVDYKTVLTKYTNDLNIDKKHFLEYFTCEMIYENVSEADLDNIINHRFSEYRSYSVFSYKISSDLTSGSIKRINGNLHHAQLGYSCVLKSMMRGIHSSISSEVDFRKFKLHITNYLISRADNYKNDLEKMQPLMPKMIDDAKLILKKREIKLQIAELLKSSETNQTEVDSLKEKLKELPRRFAIKTEQN